MSHIALKVDSSQHLVASVASLLVHLLIVIQSSVARIRSDRVMPKMSATFDSSRQQTRHQTSGRRVKVEEF